jgi:NAD+ synthase (glutamine-hydrolysing)
MGDVIPESIITRPPTAELREGQLDEEKLPPYSVLDEILRLYLEENMPIQLVQRRFGDVAVRVIKMLEAAEYKRFQMPPGPRVSQRHLTKDRRMPVLKRLNYL